MKILNQAVLMAQGVSRLFSSTTDNSCTLPSPLNFVSGSCMDVNACSGYKTPGLCPGAANIQCCTDSYAEPSGSSSGSLSDFGTSLIHSFEGYREQFYCDRTHRAPAGGGRHCEPSEGKLTIAWGHLCSPEPECDWIQVPFKQNPDGDNLFAADIASYVTCVKTRVTIDLTQNQFDALVSFAFNAGCGTLRRLATKMNSGDMDGALNFWLTYDATLKKRRAMEVNIFNS